MREQVVFPHMVFPLFIQSGDMPVIEKALAEDRLVVLAPCIQGSVPCGFKDLSRIATVCRINQVFRFPEGGCKVVVEGMP